MLQSDWKAIRFRARRCCFSARQRPSVAPGVRLEFRAELMLAMHMLIAHACMLRNNRSTMQARQRRRLT